MKTLQLSFWDYLALIAYIIMLFYIGFRAARRINVRDTDDYILGNRKLSLSAFIATLVTTWYGGILGIGEFTYHFGISSWVVFGLPYYIFAFLFAIILAGKIRTAGQYTIADMFYLEHNKPVGILGSLFLLFMTSPAPYILMVAFLLQVILGWTFLVTLIMGTFFSTLYVYFGGFRSVVQTDKFQFVLIYLSFMVLLGFIVNNSGGFVFLEDHLPPLHLSWSGGNSAQYIIVWFFLASWTFIDPGFHQRCAAAGSLSIARRGILLSILFWFIFDFLTVTSGLYAAALLSDIQPVLAYPLLADKMLPPFIKGLFLTGLLAVIMSTIDSFTFLSAITFGRDIIWRLKKNSPAGFIPYTRFGLVVTALISVILCLLFPSVIKLWYIIGTLFIPPMLVPVLTAYFPRFKLKAAYTFATMIISFLLSLALFIYAQWNSTNGQVEYLFGIEPFFPGLLGSLLLYAFFAWLDAGLSVKRSGNN
jgi:SSS family solute:Na+ symporter